MAAGTRIEYGMFRRRFMFFAFSLFVFIWLIAGQAAKNQSDQKSEQSPRPGSRQCASCSTDALAKISEQCTEHATKAGKNHNFEQTIHGSTPYV